MAASSSSSAAISTRTRWAPGDTTSTNAVVVWTDRHAAPFDTLVDAGLRDGDVFFRTHEGCSHLREYAPHHISTCAASPLRSDLE